MDIALTPEQQDIIGHAVATGRVAAPEDAVREALDLWVERERRRSEILAVVDEAEAALANGKGISAGQSQLLRVGLAYLPFDALNPAGSRPAKRHLVIYRIEGADVLILHIIHASRDLDAVLRCSDP